MQSLRKAIARSLTIINQKNKEQVISRLNVRTKVEGENNVEHRVKNLKARLLPLDLRPKLTRAKRRALTKAQQKKTTLRQLKRKLNFPLRKFAVPSN